MKTLSKSALFLALSVGIYVSFTSTGWSQNNGGYGDSGQAEVWGPDVVQSFPMDSSAPTTDVPQAVESTLTYQTENFSDQTFEQNVITDDYLFPEVKNVNFFGVDRDECCDEWEGMCGCKSPKFRCGCGGLKANKGHLGIFWLKSRYGGDGCDYCKGGCCEKKCGSRLHNLIKRCPIKNCLKKFCCKNTDEEASCGCDEPKQTSIFGRPLESNCRRCGCCDEGCPSKEICDSCN